MAACTAAIFYGQVFSRSQGKRDDQQQAVQ
jgi:hypothetical protein